MLKLIPAAAAALALLTASAPAAEKPYRVSLIGDGFDGKAWHTGVLVELAAGWKTYWRMPGDSGVPPEFTWTPSQPAKVEVAYPTPSRHVDKGGETVGYQQQVLFPVTVTPERPGDVELGLDLFFAVCKDVCVPAEAKTSILLGSEEHDPLGSVRVEAAKAGVPVAGDAITAAKLVTADGKTTLLLSLKERPEDIFVETTSSAYFRAPVISDDGRDARLAIDGLDDPAKLAGQQITLTYVIGGKGLEQTLALP